MCAFDSARIRELIGLFILMNDLEANLGAEGVELYINNGLAVRRKY